VTQGKAIYGIQSSHKNKKEDRVWQLYLCEFSTCTATSMKLLSDDFLPQPIGSAVIGIGTMPMCNTQGSATLEMARTRGLSESLSVTTGTSSAFTLGASLTISHTVGVSVDIFQASQTLSFTASTSATQTWEKSTTTDETHTTENTVGCTIAYSGINGGILVGLVDEYQFDKSNIPVEYSYKCTTNTAAFTYHKERGTIKLSGHVYGHVHCDNHQEKWNTTEECEENKECLRMLNSKLALSPSQLFTEFKKCF